MMPTYKEWLDSISEEPSEFDLRIIRMQAAGLSDETIHSIITAQHSGGRQ